MPILRLFLGDTFRGCDSTFLKLDFFFRPEDELEKIRLWLGKEPTSTEILGRFYSYARVLIGRYDSQSRSSLKFNESERACKLWANGKGKLAIFQIIEKLNEEDSSYMRILPIGCKARQSIKTELEVEDSAMFHDKEKIDVTFGGVRQGYTSKLYREEFVWKVVRQIRVKMNLSDGQPSEVATEPISVVFHAAGFADDA